MAVDEAKNQITVSAVYFAKSVYLYLEGYDDYLRLENNYFDVLPGSSVTISALKGTQQLSELKDLVRAMSLYDVTV